MAAARLVRYLLLLQRYLVYTPIICVVNRDEKIEVTKAAGADIVLNNKKCNIVQEIKSIAQNGIDITVDAVGQSEFINTSLQIISESGDILVYEYCQIMEQR